MHQSEDCRCFVPGDRLPRARRRPKMRQKEFICPALPTAKQIIVPSLPLDEAYEPREPHITAHQPGIAPALPSAHEPRPPATASPTRARDMLPPTAPALPTAREHLSPAPAQPRARELPKATPPLPAVREKLGPIANGKSASLLTPLTSFPPPGRRGQNFHTLSGSIPSRPNHSAASQLEAWTAWQHSQAPVIQGLLLPLSTNNKHVLFTEGSFPLLATSYVAGVNSIESLTISKPVRLQAH